MSESSSDPRELTVEAVKASEVKTGDELLMAGGFIMTVERVAGTPPFSPAPIFEFEDGSEFDVADRDSIFWVVAARGSSPAPDTEKLKANILGGVLALRDLREPDGRSVSDETIISIAVDACLAAVTSSPVPGCKFGICDGSGVIKDIVPGVEVPLESTCQCAAPVSVGDEPDRLALLAKGALHILDDERQATGVDEWDESDPRCFLYNAATAIIERDANAAYTSAKDAEQLIDDCLEQVQR